MSIFFHVVEDHAIKNRTRDFAVMHKLNLIHPWTSATCIVPVLFGFNHCDNYIIVGAGSILLNEEQSLNSFSVSRAHICDRVRAGANSTIESEWPNSSHPAQQSWTLWKAWSKLQER